MIQERFYYHKSRLCVLSGVDNRSFANIMGVELALENIIYSNGPRLEP